MRRFGITVARLVLVPIAAAAAMAAPVSAAFGPRSLSASRAPSSGWRPPVWRQVRIEQHFSIRITPGTAVMPPSVIEEIEEEERIEPDARKAGKCLPISSIATLAPGAGSQLLLVLRDERIIAASLEKHCAARDFYAGFYIESHADGAICAGRDTLQSRSGANCKLRRLHELARASFRRFP